MALPSRSSGFSEGSSDGNRNPSDALRCPNKLWVSTLSTLAFIKHFPYDRAGRDWPCILVLGLSLPCCVTWGKALPSVDIRAPRGCELPGTGSSSLTLLTPGRRWGSGCVGGGADTFLPNACPETWSPHGDSLGVPVTPGTWDTCLGPGHQKPSDSEHRLWGPKPGSDSWLCH